MNGVIAPAVNSPLRGFLRPCRHSTLPKIVSESEFAWTGVGRMAGSWDEIFGLAENDLNVGDDANPCYMYDVSDTSW